MSMYTTSVLALDNPIHSPPTSYYDNITSFALHSASSDWGFSSGSSSPSTSSAMFHAFSPEWATTSTASGNIDSSVSAASVLNRTHLLSGSGYAPHATSSAIAGSSSSIPGFTIDPWAASSVQGRASLGDPASESILFKSEPLMPASVPERQPSVSLLPAPLDMAVLIPRPRAPSPPPTAPPAPVEDPPERERRHPCKMCHKKFDRPSTLKKHLLVHTGEKAYQCETCGRRFGVLSNLNRHVRKCILKPVNNRGGAAAATSTSASSPTTTSTSTITSSPETSPLRATPTVKRRRRAPPPVDWVPDSLRQFNLISPYSHSKCPVPLPPVQPSYYEERDSYNENVGMRPYHPDEFVKLPGPAAGLGSRDVGNLGWEMNEMWGGQVLVF